MNQFDRLEIIAQRLIEGAFSRLFQTQLHPADLARRLARAVDDDHQEAIRNGLQLLPNFYRVTLSPGDYAKLVSGSTVEAETARLRRYLIRLIEEVNGRPVGPIEVTLDRSSAVRPGKVRVNSRHANGNGSKSRTKTEEAYRVIEEKAGRWRLRYNATEIQLGEPVLRIGRALDNDIVLNDQTVSRYHAQLRWRGDKYYLYPPVPSGVVTEQKEMAHFLPPTFVNARPEFRCPLKDGDVITLGDTVLRMIVQSNP